MKIVGGGETTSRKPPGCLSLSVFVGFSVVVVVVLLSLWVIGVWTATWVVYRVGLPLP